MSDTAQTPSTTVTGCRNTTVSNSQGIGGGSKHAIDRFRKD